jgi:hypothetical protein
VEAETCSDTERYNNINKNNSQLQLQVYVWKILIVYITQQDAPHKDKIIRKHNVSETGSVFLLRWGAMSAAIEVRFFLRDPTEQVSHRLTWGQKQVQCPKCCLVFIIPDNGQSPENLSFWMFQFSRNPQPFYLIQRFTSMLRPSSPIAPIMILIILSTPSHPTTFQYYSSIYDLVFQAVVFTKTLYKFIFSCNSCFKLILSLIIQIISGEEDKLWIHYAMSASPISFLLL